MDKQARVGLMAAFTFHGQNEQTTISLKALEVDGKGKIWTFQATGEYVNETTMFDNDTDAVDYYQFKHNHLSQVYK